MDILKTLLEITIYSAVLFAAIMLFKKAVKGKLSPVLNFVLWFLLLARLCVPLTLQSGFHLITLSQAQQEYAADDISSGSEAAQQQIPVVTDQNTPISQRAGGQQSLITSDIAQPEHQATTKAASSLDLYDVLILIWLGGASLIAVWTINIAARVSKVAGRKSVPAPSGIQKIYCACREEMGIKKKLPLLITLDLASPSLLVSLRPKILLPLAFVKEATDMQIELALRHELTHYKRMDHLICMLIDILSAVYWFNPVIWLAEKEIISDMETACDNMIVRNMEKEEKSYYANTILSMLSKKAELPLALGMALTNTKRVAEKRIRGIYMKDKSKTSVKTAALLLVMVMLAACFTTACQPARVQETDVAAAFDPAPSLEPSPETSPQESALPSASSEDRFTKSNQLSDIVTVNYDATIIKPQGNIPAASMEIRDFTETDVQKVADYFFAGRQAYNPWEQTKAELQADIDALEDLNSKLSAKKQQFEAAHDWTDAADQAVTDNGGDFVPAGLQMEKDYGVTEEDWEAYMAYFSVNSFINTNNDLIDQAKADLRKAPDAVEKQPADIEFKNALGTTDQNINQYGVKIWAENSGNTISQVKAIKGQYNGCNNTEIEYATQLAHENGAYDTRNSTPLSVPQEQAQKLAMDAVRAICPEMSLAGATTIGHAYYVFSFLRNIGNVPITYDSWGGFMYTNVDKNQPFSVFYEQIQVYVDNSGVIYFSWFNPYDNIRVTDDNSQVISLEQAQEKFEKNLLEELEKSEYTVSKDKNGIAMDSMTLNIDKIQLGLTRVMNEDGSYILVPTWDFFGEAHAERDGEEQVFNRFGQSLGSDSLGTVNALNGGWILRQGDVRNW